jgi:2-dehydropantoate 2-reductase
MACLMRGSVCDILAAPGGAQAITRYLDACIAVATKEGYAPRAPAIERFRATLSTSGSTLTASMLRDLESGGPIEADHIVGFMLEKARVHGVDDGMLAVAYAHLKAYEVRRVRNQPI